MKRDNAVILSGPKVTKGGWQEVSGMYTSTWPCTFDMVVMVDMVNLTSIHIA